jgi:hypothetical protein
MRVTLPLLLAILVLAADAVGYASATIPDPAWDWVRLAIGITAAGIGAVVVLAARDDGRWLR